MADPSNFQRAYIEIEGGEKLNAWFNPKEYTLARQNKWEVKPVPGAGLPNAQFGGSQPHKINIELLFDDSDAHDGNVSTITQKLLDMMEVNAQFGSGEKNNSRPPTVKFGWGPVIWPKAVCDSVSIQYTLFRPDGTPIRAIAKLGLTQVAKATAKSSGGGTKRQNPAKQNPTTIAIGGIRSYTVRDGDSLQSIAYAAYGDPNHWRLIADANGVDDPIRLRRGQVLAIPRLVE
jgi:Contractile injection system tube protein/LysM domain